MYVNKKKEKEKKEKEIGWLRANGIWTKKNKENLRWKQ